MTFALLAHQVRVIREARRLGLRAAAQEIGIGHNTLSRIERGNWPNGLYLVMTMRWAGLSHHLGSLEP